MKVEKHKMKMMKRIQITKMKMKKTTSTIILSILLL